MKKDVKIMSRDEFEQDVVSCFNFYHGVGLANYCEEYVEFYWDYRTEEEIRSGAYDKELWREEIADAFGYDFCELCYTQDGEECVLFWNEVEVEE